MPKPTKPETLAEKWTQAKTAEEAAKKLRTAIEELLIESIRQRFPAKQPRTEGATTYDLDNGYKVTITGKLKRTLNEENWNNASDIVPDNFTPVYESTLILGIVPEDLLAEIHNTFDRRDVTRSLVLDEAELKRLKADHPKIYDDLARNGVFDTKPQKTAVTVVKK
jgi:hypothetical protein